MKKKSSELLLIINNIKKNYLTFISINLMILLSFTLFLFKTHEIKDEVIHIKFVTTEFSVILSIDKELYNYISFKTNYNYDLDRSTIISTHPEKINSEYLEEEINIFFDQYSMMLNSLLEATTSINKDQEFITTLNSIDHYFKIVDLYESPFKLSEKTSKYRYNFLNYLTIIFSLIIFINFFSYILILIKNNLYK